MWKEYWSLQKQMFKSKAVWKVTGVFALVGILINLFVYRELIGDAIETHKEKKQEKPKRGYSKVRSNEEDEDFDLSWDDLFRD